MSSFFKISLTTLLRWSQNYLYKIEFLKNSRMLNKHILKIDKYIY